MLVPTAHCPACKKTTLLYRVLASSDLEEERLETRCVDCDHRTDRFGLDPIITEVPFRDLQSMGYSDLDRPEPLGPGGCFTTRGCEGCSKIDTRPW